MSSAETTHAVEWRSDVNGNETALVDGMIVGSVIHIAFANSWAGAAVGGDGALLMDFFPTASAARAFVERTVREAGR